MSEKDMIENLFVTGINFKKADISARGKFSLDRDNKHKFLEVAKERGFDALIVLSTCNRCEIYGLGSLDLAEEILCEITGQSRESLHDYNFSKKSVDALEHIFKVAAGLDSQILGDNEILGQFREAGRDSKEHNLLGAFFERMANTGIQVAKDIKTKTGISNGTMSVSFAAVQVINEHFDRSNMKTLLIGTGNFGKNVSKNLKNYLPEIQLTVSNRTQSKALNLAQEIGIETLPFEDIQQRAGDYEIIILCADSADFILKSTTTLGEGRKLILDLSVPRVTEASIGERENIDLLTIDHISKLLNSNLEHRKEFLPEAEAMISEAIFEFTEWHKIFSHKDNIHRVKKALMDLTSECPYLSKLDKPQLDRTMNKAMGELVQKLKFEKFSEADLEKTISYFYKINHQLVESNN